MHITITEESPVQPAANVEHARARQRIPLREKILYAVLWRVVVLVAFGAWYGWAWWGAAARNAEADAMWVRQLGVASLDNHFNVAASKETARKLEQMFGGSDNVFDLRNGNPYFEGGWKDILAQAEALTDHVEPLPADVRKYVDAHRQPLEEAVDLIVAAPPQWERSFRSVAPFACRNIITVYILAALSEQDDVRALRYLEALAALNGIHSSYYEWSQWGTLLCKMSQAPLEWRTRLCPSNAGAVMRENLARKANVMDGHPFDVLMRRLPIPVSLPTSVEILIGAAYWPRLLSGHAEYRIAACSAYASAGVVCGAPPKEIASNEVRDDLWWDTYQMLIRERFVAVMRVKELLAGQYPLPERLEPLASQLCPAMRWEYTRVTDSTFNLELHEEGEGIFAAERINISWKVGER